MSVSKTRSRASVGHVTRVQSVKIGTNRQYVHKARKGNVASGDATSASMIRTRVGVGFVTRVPWIGITLQHVSTRCRRRNDIALGGDSKGLDSSPTANEGRRPGALCSSDDVTDRTFIYAGRPPTLAQ